MRRKMAPTSSWRCPYSVPIAGVYVSVDDNELPPGGDKASFDRGAVREAVADSVELVNRDLSTEVVKQKDLLSSVSVEPDGAGLRDLRRIRLRAKASRSKRWSYRCRGSVDAQHIHVIAHSGGVVDLCEELESAVVADKRDIVNLRERASGTGDSGGFREIERVPCPPKLSTALRSGQ